MFATRNDLKLHPTLSATWQRCTRCFIFSFITTQIVVGTHPTLSATWQRCTRCFIISSITTQIVVGTALIS